MLEWINSLISSLEYWEIGLLMFIENIFPPIPAELIMPLAGFTVAQGKLNLGLVILAGTIGTLLGNYGWYYLGRLINYERLSAWIDQYGRWICISVKDIDRVNNWFNKYGRNAVFLGRMIPGIRTLISLPAGMNQMSLVTFTIYSIPGTLIWTTALTMTGFILGDNYGLIAKYLAPISKVVLFGLIGLIGYWIFKKTRSNN
jgi:membrane protein DedA with SNARE-associated domain